MKNMNLFQRICFFGFCIFLTIAVISWLIANIAPLFISLRGFAALAMLAPVAILFVCSFATAALCLGLLSQARPLSAQSSTFTNSLSIVGITFVVLGWLYTIVIFGSAFFGVGTNAPIFGFTSDVVKAGIILGVVLMHAALVASYKIVRLVSVKSISIICAVMAGIFAFMDFSDNFSPDLYRPFVIIFATISLIATIVVIRIYRIDKKHS